MHRNSGIGGQAVIEGIMMRNRERYSIAARRPDGEIESVVKPFKSVFPVKNIEKIPILRGVASFIDSLVVGISSLMWATDVAAADDEEEKAAKTDEQIKKEEKQWQWIMTGTVIFSLCFSIVLFMLLPF